MTHAAEVEAVRLAITPRTRGDITNAVRNVLEMLASCDFEKICYRRTSELAGSDVVNDCQLVTYGALEPN